MGSSRGPLPSPRRYLPHRVLAATWNCSSFSVCSWVRSRSSGAAILPPPLRFWPVRTVTCRNWSQQQPLPVGTTAGAQLRLRGLVLHEVVVVMMIVRVLTARGRHSQAYPEHFRKLPRECWYPWHFQKLLTISWEVPKVPNTGRTFPTPPSSRKLWKAVAARKSRLRSCLLVGLFGLGYLGLWCWMALPALGKVLRTAPCDSAPAASGFASLAHWRVFPVTYWRKIPGIRRLVFRC